MVINFWRTKKLKNLKWTFEVFKDLKKKTKNLDFSDQFCSLAFNPLCVWTDQMLPAAGLTQQSATDTGAAAAVVPQISSQVNQLQINQPSVRFCWFC